MQGIWGITVKYVISRFNPENTDALNKSNRDFLEKEIKDCAPKTGTAINKILPPASLFTKTNDQGKKRTSALDKIKAFFERFKNIS